jgi:hypothetical protein
VYQPRGGGAFVYRLDAQPFATETEGSNPSPSSGASTTNPRPLRTAATRRRTWRRPSLGTAGQPGLLATILVIIGVRMLRA